MALVEKSVKTRSFRWVTPALYVCFLVFGAFVPTQADDILNFSEWKAQKVLEAEQNLSQTRSASRSSQRSKKEATVTALEGPERSSVQYGGATNPVRMRIQIEGPKVDSVREAQKALSAARELNAADYYLLYLKFRSPEVIRRMCEKLSKSELIEILAASSPQDHSADL